jgi:anhydro-N-acetylmuramic acid kinase
MLSINEIIEKEDFRRNRYTMIATGGGALNKYLIACIAKYSPEVEIEIPSTEIVQFKEGMLMALMGVLRLEQIPNCIGSVTGAAKDAIGGAVYRA